MTARSSRDAIVVALLALAACRGGDRADRTADTAVAPWLDTATHRTDSATAVAPLDTAAHHDSAARRDTTPVLLVAVDSALGDSIYHNSRGRCLTCHGPRGTGNASLGPSLRDSIWLDIDGSVPAIASVIRDGIAEGKGGHPMPAFGAQLDSTAIHRLAVYVYSLSHAGVTARDSAAARAALPVAHADSAIH